MIVFNRYFLISFLFFSSLFVFGDAVQIVSSIRVSGLKRTRESTVRDIIAPVSEGTEFTESIPETIIQKMREAGIFTPDIDVKYIEKGNQVEIEILAEDRWTLFPMPVITYADGGDWNLGAIVYEGNFLGLNNSLGTGLIFRPDGWNLLSFYGDKSVFDTDLALGTYFFGGRNDNELSDIEGNPVREYSSDDIIASVALTKEVNSLLFVDGGLSFSHADLLEQTGRYSDIYDLDTFGLNGGILAKDMYYDTPYNHGWSVRIQGAVSNILGSADFYASVSGNTNISFSPWFDHLLSFDVRGASTQAPVQKIYTLGRSKGSFTLPDSHVGADQYASGTMAYHLPVLKLSSGTFSFVPFYEAGIFHSPISEGEFYQGTGISFEFTLSKVAMPAFAWNINWNLKTGKQQFVIGLGM